MKPATGEINTQVPSLNGGGHVINKNRIPPGKCFTDDLSSKYLKMFFCLCRRFQLRSLVKRTYHLYFFFRLCNISPKHSTQNFRLTLNESKINLTVNLLKKFTLTPSNRTNNLLNLNKSSTKY